MSSTACMAPAWLADAGMPFDGGPVPLGRAVAAQFAADSGAKADASLGPVAVAPWNPMASRRPALALEYVLSDSEDTREASRGGDCHVMNRSQLA